MAHVSLYRKYRPETFEQLVGQPHITTTLSKAIDSQTWHHAYLFTGPRGTGKTSTARLLAMCLNSSTGPTSHPDPEDPNVRSIRLGASPDVIEIDAASHNGVDDVRDLREGVAYAPAQGQLKVYIVDECHMLSDAAWNAFLKTIEDPPPHVIFIFATTEPHKVLPTVLSRTQRLDFRRVSTPVLTEHCQRICALEGVTIAPDALAQVVAAGDGSVRDTLSVLDQVIAFSGNDITSRDIQDVLGTVPSERLDALCMHLANHSVADMLSLVHSIAQDGIDLQQFTNDAIAHLRNVMLMVVAPEARMVEAPADRLHELASQGAPVGAITLLRTIQLLNDAKPRMRAGSTRLPLELALAKAALPHHSDDDTALAARMDQMEEMLKALDVQTLRGLLAGAAGSGLPGTQQGAVGSDSAHSVLSGTQVAARGEVSNAPAVASEPSPVSGEHGSGLPGTQQGDVSGGSAGSVPTSPVFESASPARAVAPAPSPAPPVVAEPSSVFDEQDSGPAGTQQGDVGTDSVGSVPTSPQSGAASQAPAGTPAEDKQPEAKTPADNPAQAKAPASKLADDPKPMAGQGFGSALLQSISFLDDDEPGDDAIKKSQGQLAHSEAGRDTQDADHGVAQETGHAVAQDASHGVTQDAVHSVTQDASQAGDAHQVARIADTQEATQDAPQHGSVLHFERPVKHTVPDAGPEAFDIATQANEDALHIAEQVHTEASDKAADSAPLAPVVPISAGKDPAQESAQAQQANQEHTSRLARIWPSVQQRCDEVNPNLGKAIKKAQAGGMEGDLATVWFSSERALQVFAERENMELLASIISQTFGKTLRVNALVGEAPEQPARKPSPMDGYTPGQHSTTSSSSQGAGHASTQGASNDAGHSSTQGAGRSSQGATQSAGHSSTYTAPREPQADEPEEVRIEREAMARATRTVIDFFGGHELGQ